MIEISESEVVGLVQSPMPDVQSGEGNPPPHVGGYKDLVCLPNGSVDGVVKSAEPASQFSGGSDAAPPLLSLQTVTGGEGEKGKDQSELTLAATEVVFPAGTRKQDIEEAHERARLCREYLELTKLFSGNQAAKRLGKAASWFSAMVPLYRSGGVAALLPRRRDCGVDEGADAKLVSEGDIARINSIYLKTNRAKRKGSKNQAIKAYCLCADCPQAFKEMVNRRWRARRQLLPPSVMSRIWISESTFGQYRNPTAAGLDYLSAPGSLMWYTDPSDGQRKFIQPGQRIEGDDATINFPVTIPWEMGGCPCSEKFGVKVERFQWLVPTDVGSRFVPAWTYVCRPRSSYRAEDPITLMNAVYREYGEPEFWRFERHIWESNLVKKRVALAGSKLWTVYSPHQKPFIEGLFNKFWTIMSIEDGQVGRFRGEMEKENSLLMAAKQGRFDPRGTFPKLSQAIDVFQRSVQQHNGSIIRSKLYGEWIPAERWERRILRKASLDLDWLAAPMVKRWMVRGNTVGGQVRLFDGYSAPFTFAAEWLTPFHGARVDCHFDPTQARCTAVATLAEDFGGRAAGELLGSVHLVNECASYARLVLEWGDDDRGLGRKIRAQSQSAMRRNVSTITADGKVGARTDEIRDGLGNSAKIQTGRLGDSETLRGEEKKKTYVLDPSKTFTPKSSSREKAQEAEPSRPRKRIRDLYAEETPTI